MEKLPLRKIKQLFRYKTFRIMGIILILLLLVFIVFHSFYSIAYAQKIYPGIKLGALNLGGLTPEAARGLLFKKSQDLSSQPGDIVLSGENKSWPITISDLQIEYNIPESVDELFSIGRDGSVFKNILWRTALVVAPEEHQVAFKYNKKFLDDTIYKIEKEIEKPVSDAVIELENGKLKTIKEQIGLSLDEDQLRNTILKNIGQLQYSLPVVLETAEVPPKIYESDLASNLSTLERLIKTPVTLQSDQKVFTIEKKDIYGWLEFAALQDAKTGKYLPSFQFNQDKIKVFIANIADELNKDPKDAKLVISGGRAVVFQSSQDGYELDQSRAMVDIEKLLGERKRVAGVSSENDKQQGASEIALSIKVRKPAISNETINDLGIKELIGNGATSFARSPENRRYNINLGASLFNGTLIKPGEEFSFLQVLGEVSEARGFKKELAIKEDRTEPEVGGGLCQVSTTMFRAALNSGLEISERTNHKYRVSYYEPPVGMDATVYEPSPDLKFINNTPGYVLIQSKISGSNITFEFYGTVDGRKIEISDPVVYDRVDPGEPVYIDDPTLLPGETKQIEKAHQGARASFSYKVTSKEGKILTEKTFHSKYVAWQARYLRGPQAAVSSSEEPAPSPSPSETSSPSPTEPPGPSPSPTAS